MTKHLHNRARRNTTTKDVIHDHSLYFIVSPAGAGAGLVGVRKVDARASEWVQYASPFPASDRESLFSVGTQVHLVGFSSLKYSLISRSDGCSKDLFCEEAYDCRPCRSEMR